MDGKLSNLFKSGEFLAVSNVKKIFELGCMKIGPPIFDQFLSPYIFVFFVYHIEYTTIHAVWSETQRI